MSDEQKQTEATPEAAEPAAAPAEESAPAGGGEAPEAAPAAEASEAPAAARNAPAEGRPARSAEGGPRRRDERRRYPRRRKFCRFCAEKREPDYKDPDALRPFLTDRFKIVPRRITGTCAYHQRQLTKAVKRARLLALLPYTTLHKGWFTHEVQKVVRGR